MQKAAFVYNSPENHVEKRRAISSPLRRAMFDIPRDAWPDYPRFRGEAEFWTQIHEGLLSASADLPARLKLLIDEKDPEAMRQMAARVARFGGNLAHHAHGHHHIEDHHFFPGFLAMFPQLGHALEMLDGDHKVLGEVLDDLESAVRAFPAAPQGSDREQREAILAAAARMLPPAERLDALFIRHIGDEEEICIPAMIRV